MIPEREDLDAELADLDPSRRAFIKRVAAGAAGAAVVTSFSMAGLTASPAFAQLSNTS